MYICDRKKQEIVTVPSQVVNLTDTETVINYEYLNVYITFSAGARHRPCNLIHLSFVNPTVGEIAVPSSRQMRSFLLYSGCTF